MPSELPIRRHENAGDKRRGENPITWKRMVRGEGRDAGLADDAGEAAGGEVRGGADVALLLLLVAVRRYGAATVEGHAAHTCLRLHRRAGREGPGDAPTMVAPEWTGEGGEPMGWAVRPSRG